MEIDNVKPIVASILNVFAGKLPLTMLEQIVADDVICYMDRVKLNIGRSGLRTWFCYIHATMRKRHISVNVDISEFEVIGPGRYRVSGPVVIREKDGETETRRFTVAYLIESGKMTTVWSTRSNYVGIVGRSIELPLYVGYIYHCLRAWYYRASGAAPGN